MALIIPQQLLPHLGAAAVRLDVDALDQCDSSNAELMRRLDAPSGSVVVADIQTAGRGRRGRVWESSPLGSLTFSLLWRFPPGANLSGLSLAAGLSVVEALEKLGGHGVRLKWPNDILFQKKSHWGKLGGLLIELSSDSKGMQAVIGVGLNLTQPGVDLNPPASGLDEVLLPFPDRHRLLGLVLQGLVATLDEFSAHGFGPFRDAWQARHIWQGRHVCLNLDGERQAEGLCQGVDEDGALLLRTAAGSERFIVGDLSLRPL
ncbi:MAG: hypothetical protein RIR00_2200 [Pseudomonadota bacterium]|jgi:BirA family biotin operon repressor/biotin-[acetyl-CoA-carboxylase] ligase